jgi:phosphoglycolate phosphatase-like HAD superfamily hydrolase
MIIFDVDGTLVGGEAIDWASFGAAFEEVAGFALDRPFFERIEEVTAQAIVHQALEHFPIETRKQMERAVSEGFVRRLRAAHEANAGSFPAVEGAVALLEDLRGRGVPVAIATGDWFDSITFKLRAAGIPFSEIPMVTSSDFYGRAEIIAAAAAKAGRPLHEAVYIGDGLWDMRACQKLGIPFIGVGCRAGKLRGAGAPHTLEVLEPVAFWKVLETARQATVQRVSIVQTVTDFVG